MAVEAARRLVARRDGLAARWPKGVAICLVVALVVSAPFLASIAWHYRLQVRNAAPMAFVSPELALENAWSFVRVALTPSVHGLIAAAGWVWLVRRRRELEARVLLVASITALAFLLYSYLVQTDVARALALSGIVPGHHFVYYLRAFEAVAFGLGSTRLPAGSRTACRRPFPADGAPAWMWSWPRSSARSRSGRPGPIRVRCSRRLLVRAADR